MKSFVFKTGEQAWAGVNKMFINQEPGLFEGEQGASITNSLTVFTAKNFHRKINQNLVINKYL